MSDMTVKSEFEPPKGKLKNLRTLWSFMTPYRGRMLLAGFFLVIAATTVLVIPSALEGIVDSFSRQGTGNIRDYIGFLIATVIIMALATACRFYFITWLGERVVADIRKGVYERLITLSPEFFEVNRPGEIVSRLTADTTLVQSIVGSSVSIWARNTLIAIVGTIWLFVMSPKLMGLISIVIPVIIVIIVVVGRRVRTLSRTSQDKVADVGAQAAESLAALNIVQAFTQEEAEADRFGERVDEAFFAARKRIRVRAFLTATIIFLVFGAIALVIYQGFQDVSSGAMTSGEMTAFIFRAILVAGAFGALSEVYSELQRAAGAAGRLAELLNATSMIEAPRNPVAMPEIVDGSIKFDKVNFAYPSKQNEQALKNFSLTVKPGETVALVGPSGAGKSTVLQLLLRFYDPQDGGISIDGIDITKTDPSDFREHIAFVPQETIVFADSFRGNIRYGREDASDQEVIKAAEAAAAREFIERTEEGFDTFLGERGTRLSGGQRQRIAIARAILRDSPILLLDEATSALDAESELKVQTALEHLMEGRTTLVIAHRLATVKKADRIIVMDEGQIVAEGTHEDLVAQQGLYKRLADLQFGGAN